MSRREFVWCLIELPNGKKEWYCLSRVLRQALLFEKNNLKNRYWKNTLIGNYLTIGISPYVNGRTKLSVGRVLKIRIRFHGDRQWHWSRNQFVTQQHLLNLKDAYNYLKHNYSWYNRFAIKMALIYWRNRLRQREVRHICRRFHKKRVRIHWRIKNMYKYIYCCK